MKIYKIGLVVMLAVSFCVTVYAGPPIGVKGDEAGNATVHIWPDEGDDADDQMQIVGTTTGNLSFRGTSGTNEVASLDMSTGALTLDGGITGPVIGTTYFAMTATSSNTIDAQSLSGSAGTIILTNSKTVTNTIANPTVAGQHLWITSVSSTNLFISSTNANMSINGLTNVGYKIQMNADDVLHLMSPDTTSWAGVSFIVN